MDKQGDPYNRIMEPKAILIVAFIFLCLTASVHASPSSTPAQIARTADADGAAYNGVLDVSSVDETSDYTYLIVAIGLVLLAYVVFSAARVRKRPRDPSDAEQE
jgi:hypothetical protein